MKKVLSVLLLTSLIGASSTYGACVRCEWKNCKNNSNWVVRKARATKCAINRAINRVRGRRNSNKYRNANCPVHKNGNIQNEKECKSKNCPIHNEDKRCCKRFCVKCGRCHLNAN